MKIPEKLKPYLGRIALTLAGLVTGILFLTLGFFKTLVVVLLTTAGYLLGCWKDRVWAPAGFWQMPERWHRR